jgi:hypothetical protein
METTTRTARQATPQRWQAALTRALDNGVRVYQISGTGQWVATSASKPGVCFAVSVDACECEAAMLGADPVCQHRAALRCELGMLWPEDPTPPTPAAPAVARPRFACARCEDTGFVHVANRYNPSLTFRATCPDCDTRKQIPTTTFLVRRKVA